MLFLCFSWASTSRADMVCYGLARPRRRGPQPTVQEERDLVFFFLASRIQMMPPPFIDGGRLKA
jgi:hypothetical protein